MIIKKLIVFIKRIFLGEIQIEGNMNDNMKIKRESIDYSRDLPHEPTPRTKPKTFSGATRKDFSPASSDVVPNPSPRVSPLPIPRSLTQSSYEMRKQSR